MGQKKLVVEILFDEEQDPEDPDYSFLEFASMEVRAGETTLTADEMSGLAETFGQSDWYWVGFCGSFISLLDGKRVSAEDVKY